MIRSVIIEDEPLAAERLGKLIAKAGSDLQVVAILDSIASAVKWFGANNCDLIFLDIHLSDGIGFRIFEKAEVRAPIIFTTAFDQYAIRAFKLNSVDYLLKPVDEKELYAAIEKFRSRNQAAPDWKQLLHALEKPEYQKRFMVSSGQKIKSIEVNEIAYLYADEKIVIMQTRDSSGRFPLDYTLDKLDSMLDPEKFFRINRKLIVNMDAIKNMYPYSKGRIVLELQPKPEFETVVSIDRAAEFKQWLNK
jgi:DNA-binding LytR/AlgR family response regulator